MVSLLSLMLVPALVGVAIYSVSLLFSHPTPKVPIAVQSPSLATSIHPILVPPTISPTIFSLVPTPSPHLEPPAIEDQVPFPDSSPEVQDRDQDRKEPDLGKSGKVDSKHDDDEEDEDTEEEEEKEDDNGDTRDKHGESGSHKKKGYQSTADKPKVIETEKKKLSDMSEDSTLTRGIAEGEIFTGEEEIADEGTENDESNWAISVNEDEVDEGQDYEDEDYEDEDYRDENDEDEADEDEDDNLARRSIKTKGNSKGSQQRHHHHRVSQKKISNLLRRSRIAAGGNIQHIPPHQPRAVHPPNNDFEKESKTTEPKLTLKEIIDIARSVKVPDPVKTMYPLQPELEKRKAKQPAEKTNNKHAKGTKGKGGKKETKSKSEARPEDLEAAINAIVDEQSDSLERALSQIANKIATSPELEQHKDVVEYLLNANIKAEEKLNLESFTHSKIMEQERDLGQKDQRILLFRNPKAVSRAEAIFKAEDGTPTPTGSDVSKAPSPSPAPPSVAAVFFQKILNVLAPPFILQLRADLRNLLFWLCSTTPGAHIDGKDANGDDSLARRLAMEDRATLVQPDGSVFFKDIWDARIGAMALECLKRHWEIFLKEILDLFWKRFTSVKEFLIDQLRGAIGLPQNMVPFLLGALGDLSSNIPEAPKPFPLRPPSTPAAKQSGLNMYVPPPDVSAAFQPVTKAVVFPSPGQDPLHEGFSNRPSQDRRGPRGVQRSEQGGGFVSWVVNTIFAELTFFFDAAQKANILSPGQGDSYLNQFRMETDDSSVQQCFWMKERVLKALKE